MTSSQLAPSRQANSFMGRLRVMNLIIVAEERILKAQIKQMTPIPATYIKNFAINSSSRTLLCQVILSSTRICCQRAIALQKGHLCRQILELILKIEAIIFCKLLEKELMTVSSR